MMKGYYSDESIIQSLKDSLAELDEGFNIHSINWDDVKVQPKERTERLARYSDLKQRFETTLQGVLTNQQTVEDILSYIDDDEIKEAIEGVYARGRTWRSYAMNSYYSESGFKDHVNSVLLDAIRKYEKGEEN